ncbi:MAG: porin family protein [Rickettsiales bacterium]|nr:porin family protein [Rickettsiales bacterium]
MRLISVFFAIIFCLQAPAFARIPVENGGVILPLPGDSYIPKEEVEQVLTPGISSAQPHYQQRYQQVAPMDVPLEVDLSRHAAMPQAIPTHDPVPVINTPRHMERNLAYNAPVPYTHQREAMPFKHWYAGMKAEYITLEDWEFVSVTGGTASKGLIDFDGGYGVAAFAGYRLNEHFRFELEVDYHHNEADTARIGGTTLNLSNSGVEGYAVMANAYLDMPIQSAKYVIPYLGLGVGHFFQTNGAEEDATAYQGMAGLAFDINDVFGVKGGYRYFSTTGLDFQPEEYDLDSHIFEFGFYARF